MKLKTWWKYMTFYYDIYKIVDTSVDHIKGVTYWHPEYKEFRTVLCLTKNIVKDMA